MESETRTFSGLTGKSYRLSYSYGLGGQLQQVNYAGLNASSENRPTPKLTAPATQVATLGTAALPTKDKLNRGLAYSTKPVSLLPKLDATSFTPSGYPTGYVRRAASLGGQPIAGATVTCSSYPYNGQWTTTTTDANGYYDCGTLSGPQFSILVSKPGWYFTYTQQGYDYAGTPSSPTTTISGTVTTPGGQAISGATVTLTGTQNLTTTSDSNGAYSFTVNTPGDFSISASKSGYDFMPISLQRNEVVQPQTVSFHGTVVQSPNQPPSGNTFFSRNVNYAYKATGALQSIGTSMIGSDALHQTNVVASLNYRAFGSARQVIYANDRKQELGYNVATMQLGGQTTTRWDGTDKIVDYTYTYTENGLISSITDGVDANYNRGYLYNGRNQLKKMEYRVGYWEYWKYTNYTHDAWGNLTAQTTVIPYASSAGQTFSYPMIGSSQTPATNRLSSVLTYDQGQATSATTNFSYDNAGNMTQAGTTTYEWDAANRLKSVNSGALGSYGYDGNGKRVKKTEGGGTTYYVYSSVLGSAVLEVAAAGVQRAYVMGGTNIVAQLNPNGNFYWLHVDHLGSGRKMTDAAGNVVYRAEYEPYGKLTYEWSSPTNLTTKKFTGYERDAATGLDYAQARMYQSEWGRFMSADKLGLTGARLINPKSLNRYSYASGDPINRVDRNGLEDIPWMICTNCSVTIQEDKYGWIDVGGGFGGELYTSDSAAVGWINKNAPAEAGEPVQDNQQAINDAVADVNSIFESDNPCTQFFGGKTVATLVMSQLAKLLKPGVVQTKNEQGRLVDNTTTGISMSLPYSGIPTGVDGWYYRLPTTATVNTKGPFLTGGNNFGGYGSSSAKGRALAILHELAHMISNMVMDDGESRVWLIKNDGGDTDASIKNTEIVKKACKEQIEKLK